MHRFLLTLAVLLVWPAGASAKSVTCRSGKTLFSQGSARVFERPLQGPGLTVRIYMCSPKVRRPRPVADNVGVDMGFGHFAGFGRYVGFTDEWEDGVTAGWDARWVDLATGDARSANIDERSSIEEGEPEAVAVDSDGSIAFLELGREHKAVIGWALNGIYDLGDAKLVKALDEEVVPSSLTFAGGVVSWRTEAGATGSASVR